METWLTKNIRPLTLIVIIVIYTAFACFDGNIGAFNISDNYVELLGQWGMLIMSFYFGGRTTEKVIEKLNQKKENENNS